MDRLIRYSYTFFLVSAVLVIVVLFGAEQYRSQEELQSPSELTEEEIIQQMFKDMEPVVLTDTQEQEIQDMYDNMESVILSEEQEARVRNILETSE